MDEEMRDLIASESRSLLRLAWLLTGNRSDAEDLVQDVWVSALVHRRQVLSADSPVLYLRTMLINRRTSLLRRWLRRPALFSPALGIPDDERVNERDALLRALSELSAQQRAIVALRYVDDLSVADTARVLGCSVSSVTTQSARALQHLRASPQLAGFMGDSTVGGST